jgi:DNA-binding response OmpR family regulator
MSKKILIADDEPNIVTSLEFLMRKAGYEVRVARDGEEALAQMETFQPDLVLLDVMMPKVSGYDLCQRLRSHPQWKHVRIVMLSAKGLEVEVTKGMSLGADLYVTKPFSSGELVDKVGTLLASAG